MTSQPALGRPDAAAVERAAAQVLQAGFLRGDSAFTPGTSIWTTANFTELKTSFIDQPDISGSSFETKLEKQLADVSDGAIQLFAEIFYLNLLPLHDYKGSTKRRLLDRVLGMMRGPAQVPSELDVALDGGVFNGGVAFKTRRFQQLALLIEFARRFRGLGASRQQSAIQDPHRFHEELDAVTDHREPAQRHALLYLAWPSYYLPIVNGDHRRAIRRAFADRIGGATEDLDADLRRIYDHLVQEHDGAVDLYVEPWRSEWNPQAFPSPSPTPWDVFMHWAARFAADIDLDREERDYKVQAAERITVALQQLDADDQNWTTSMRSALNVNLVDTFFRVAFFDDLRDHTDEVGAAIATLMGPGPRSDALDAFHKDLKSISGRNAYTTGNATALGSLLFMSRDLAEFPPYRPMPVTKALELTGRAKPAAAPSARFEALLDLCDEVLERAGDSGIELRDRLDAQGLIWTTVTYDPPEEWSEADRAALRAWRGTPTKESPATRQGAWLVRHHGRLETWLRDGILSVDAGHLREVDPGTDQEELRRIVDDDYASTAYTVKARLVDQFNAFLNRMRDGDLVLTTEGSTVHFGVLAGDAMYEAGDGERPSLQRSVAWSVRRDVSRLSPTLAAVLQSPDDVVELTAHLLEIDALHSGVISIEPPQGVRLAPPDRELADRLHIDLDWLRECAAAIVEKKQLIFYGPPGTGKTFLALALAEHLAGERSRVRLVQFHPAYSYEDFFEGYRPTASGGFALRPGPLRKVVDQARRDPTNPYFLVIDEINRGNLAKVFGELYFLLEYRDQQIDLLYGADDAVGFTLPENVFVIGTMNTADRSIALVDTAMRRRFAFIELHPGSEPVAGLLRTWLGATGAGPDAADLLDALNERIGDPEAAVGPAYFMKPGGQSPEGIARTWRTAILPLLEERHYGDGTDVHRTYGLPAIRSAIRPRDLEALTPEESGEPSGLADAD
ncbi:McrB family protein [Cellulomonas hominis]